jgi:hypothetical protein
MNEPNLCTNYVSEATSVRAAVAPLLQEQQTLARTIRLLSERERLKSGIARNEKAVKSLEAEVEQKEANVNKIKTALYKKQSQLETALKRQMHKPNIIQTMTDVSVAKLPLLHQFRQLLSVAQAISEERKIKTEELVKIFPSDSTEPTALNTYTAQILVLISEIACVPLPFPVAFGSMASSPLLAIPAAALVSGTYPEPRLLHPSQRRLAILEGPQTPLAQRLIVDDVVFVAAVFGVAFATAIDNFTVLTALNSAIRAGHFGNPFSPTSMRIAPFESGDDKIADNHEWTVLDSSYVLLCSFEIEQISYLLVKSIFKPRVLILPPTTPVRSMTGHTGNLSGRNVVSNSGRDPTFGRLIGIFGVSDFTALRSRRGGVATKLSFGAEFSTGTFSSVFVKVAKNTSSDSPTCCISRI